MRGSVKDNLPTNSMQFQGLKPIYMTQPPAWFYSRILVGAGEMLTPAFCNKYNITHVINCAFPVDSPRWWRERFASRYACMSAFDTAAHNILDWYPKFEQTLTDFLRQGDGTVFVHCQCGINRSAFLALTYVTTHFGLDYAKTYDALKKQRPCMFSNGVFRKQTEEFVNGRLQS